MAYLLDANVFIQAKNLHYGFDFCPALPLPHPERDPEPGGTPTTRPTTKTPS